MTEPRADAWIEAALLRERLEQLPRYLIQWGVAGSARDLIRHEHGDVVRWADIAALLAGVQSSPRENSVQSDAELMRRLLRQWRVEDEIAGGCVERVPHPEPIAIASSPAQLTIRCVGCGREIWQSAEDWVTLGQARQAKCSDCYLAASRPPARTPTEPQED